MIHTVEFRNLKGLRHLKLDLERFTVLVGPNASGKTSILEGLFYLTRSLNQKDQFTVPWDQDFFTTLTRGASDAIDISLEADEGERRIVLSPSLSGNSVGWKLQGFNSKSPDDDWIAGGFMQTIPRALGVVQE